MRVSLNTIKQYTDVNLSVDELVAKINEQLGSVEEVIDLGKRYEGAAIAKVVSCKKHENADKLSVCEIDAGTGENVQVVCGAPNVREGIFVVWLKPGATVPSSFVEKEPFVLEARELRGVVSNGMLASAKELGIGDSHDGILEIDPDEWKPVDVEIKPGVKFAEAYGLNDYLIDIENKMLTHRPDCFGQLGIAREIAGIQGKQFVSPKWYASVPNFSKGSGLEFTVTNDAKKEVPRFMAVAIKDVTIKASPLWLRAELVRLGGKPINNVVDVTNYIMLLTAQPTHAYDYDKLRGHALGTRKAKVNETVHLLNGKDYTLNENDIVIVDGEGPVGLAGIMGGGNSEVSAETKNIVLECANFDMYAVRKSSMRHGLFTDALTRFNKGQSRHQNPYALNLLMQSIHDVAGGEQASSVFDEHSASNESNQVEVAVSFINERLGLKLSSKAISTLLQNVEFKVEGSESLNVTVPFWRTDIELSEDIVEEVGRLYGFDKLPRELPQRSMAPSATNTQLSTKQLVREVMKDAGANEVLTYSFVHEKLLKNAGQDSAQAFKLSNAMSPELQYYRLSLLPSLLDKVRPNSKYGYDEFLLYEVGKAHNKFNLNKDGLPIETELIEAVYASKQPRAGAAYYTMRRIVEHLAKVLGVEVSFDKFSEDPGYAGMAPFDLERSSLVKANDGSTLGIVGELKDTVRQNFKLPDYVAAASLSFDALYAAQTGTVSYKVLSRFPSVTQDVSLRVDKKVAFSDVYSIAKKVLEEQDVSIQAEVWPINIYQPEEEAHKTFTLRLKVASLETTLKDADVQAIIDVIAKQAAKAIGAQKI